HRLSEGRLGLGTLPRLAHDLLTSVLPGMRGFNPFFNFNRIAGWEAELGVRSAFFVPAEKAAWSRLDLEGELRFLSRAGHEIGWRASSDSLANLEGAREELDRFARIGLTVNGMRGPWDQRSSDRAAETVSDLGLEYRSSVAFDRIPGFRAGTC